MLVPINDVEDKPVAVLLADAESIVVPTDDDDITPVGAVLDDPNVLDDPMIDDALTPLGVAVASTTDATPCPSSSINVIIKSLQKLSQMKYYQPMRQFLEQT